MKFKKKSPMPGERRKRKKFIWFPLTVKQFDDGEVHNVTYWLEFVTVMEQYNFYWSRGFEWEIVGVQHPKDKS